MFKVDFNQSVAMDEVPSASAVDSLQELMAMHHVTQADFAQHIAISQKQLSFILNRKAYMSIAVAKRIEQATGVSARLLAQLDFNYRLAHEDGGDSSLVTPFDWASA